MLVDVPVRMLVQTNVVGLSSCCKTQMALGRRHVLSSPAQSREKHEYATNEEYAAAKLRENRCQSTTIVVMRPDAHARSRGVHSTGRAANSRLSRDSGRHARAACENWRLRF